MIKLEGVLIYGQLGKNFELPERLLKGGGNWLSLRNLRGSAKFVTYLATASVKSKTVL